MTSKKWVNGYAPMYDSKNAKLTTVPYGAVVESFGWEEVFNGVPRENVAWQSAAKKYDGFIYSGYLEPYVESFPKNCVVIDSQTPDPTDAEQFALLHGMKQVNLCGELCAAFLLGIPLADLLAEWHRQEPRIYESVFRLFSSRLARGTGLSSLSASTRRRG